MTQSMPRHTWPEWRMRYLLRQHFTTEQKARLATAEKVSFVPMEAVGEHGGIDLSRVRDKEDVEKGYTLFFDGDVVVAKITPCFENRKGALAGGLHGGVAYGTTELHVLSPKPNLNERFLFYVTISDDFRKMGEAAMKGAAGQKRVPDDFIQDFRLGLPPLHVQRLIAEYLDAETAQIDALLAEKLRMLALLEEKRAALVSLAVTHGVIDAPTKASGTLWLGDIPRHWEVRRAKALFSVRDTRSENGDEELMTVSHITGVTPRAEKEVFMFKAEDMTGYKRCETGDLVVNTLWAWMGAMGVAWQPGIVSPDYHVYVSTGELKPPYIDALSRSKPFIAEVNRFSKGVWSSRLRLYPEAFMSIYMPVPPPEDQDAIINAISSEREKTATLENALKHSISLLKERRSALVTAAVTGQIPPEAMSQ